MSLELLQSITGACTVHTQSIVYLEDNASHMFTAHKSWAVLLRVQSRAKTQRRGCGVERHASKGLLRQMMLVV